VTSEKRKLQRVYVSSFILILSISFGFFITSPPGAAPDELTHSAASWYTFSNMKPPAYSTQNSGEIPSSLIIDNECYKFKPQQDASCIAAKNSDVASGYPMMTYSPVYYFLVGLGQHLASVFDYKYAAFGGRIASLFLSLFFVFLIFRKLYIENYQQPYLILLPLTPMAVFLSVTVNPSGTEVTSGLLLTTLLHFKLKGVENSDKVSKIQSNLPIILSSLYFFLSRPSALIWFGVLITALILSIEKNHWIKLLRQLTFMVGPITVAIVYHLTHPHKTGSPGGYVPVENDNFRFYLDGFITSLENLPTHLRQSYGVLGWLDTPAPVFVTLVFYFLYLIVISDLHKFSKISINSTILLIFGNTVLISLLELIAWHEWPNWWQGRYSLPLLAMTFWIFYLRANNNKSDLIRVSAFVVIFMHLILIIENLFRYSFGIIGFFPARLTDPAIGEVRFNLAVVSLVISIIAAIQLFLKTSYSKKSSP
jgi:hypothetical protein